MLATQYLILYFSPKLENGYWSTILALLNKEVGKDLKNRTFVQKNSRLKKLKNKAGLVF